MPPLPATQQHSANNSLCGPKNRNPETHPNDSSKKYYLYIYINTFPEPTYAIFCNFHTAKELGGNRESNKARPHTDTDTHPYPAQLSARTVANRHEDYDPGETQKVLKLSPSAYLQARIPFFVLSFPSEFDST
ncbi:uncharacterized protein DMAD_12754 [Drosophila madeirensis]|uniref:Uncharacterized protein n=1 Tax=Drosophila madeirensis TaxID=30013 RepID=A0AAU9FHX2_DROMD